MKVKANFNFKVLCQSIMPTACKNENTRSLFDTLCKRHHPLPLSFIDTAFNTFASFNDSSQRDNSYHQIQIQSPGKVTAEIGLVLNRRLVHRFLWSGGNYLTYFHHRKKKKISKNNKLVHHFLGGS